MGQKRFLHYWDNIRQFLEDLFGVLALFALLFIALWAPYIFG